MGTILQIQGADFRVNGMLMHTPSWTDAMSDLQANALPVGKALICSNGTNVQIVSSTTRAGVDKTTFSGTSLKIKVRSGFQVAAFATDGVRRITTKTDGTWADQDSWAWVTTPNYELTLDIAEYDTIAINIRYDDNVTTFTSNTLTDFFEYAKVLA